VELRRSRVLVTGASRGIGEQVARKLASAGASVALVARSEGPLEKLAAELGGHAYPTDLSDPAAVVGLISRIENDGPLDVLVNNAAIELMQRYTSYTEPELRSLFQLNLITPAELCRQVIPGMLERGRGQLVNISSIAASMNGAGIVAYAASKAGLSHFSAGLRAELSGAPIGVTLVELGLVKTVMMDSLYKYGPTRRSVERLEALHLAPQMEPDRVADAIVAAIASGKRHLRLPARSRPMLMLSEAPRRLTEMILLGVDQQSD
jgi:short-subunit dehydrogenase